MKCEVKDVSQCCKVLSIDVPQQTINDAYEAYYKQIVPQAKIPGFRPGKAPHTVVAQHYKKQAKEEVLKRVVTDSFHAALDDKALNPLGYPEFDDINFTDTELSFKARIEIKPEVKLKKYKGISVKKDTFKIEEKDVDEVIDRIREGYAKYVPVEDRGVELGDFAVCDITNSLDGEEAESKKDEWVEVRENEMIPGFATKTVGMQTGETRDIEVVLPDTFPNEQMRGKSATFRVVLKEIKKKQLPDIDEDFLKQVGDYANADDFRTAVKKDIEQRKTEEIDAKVERDLLDKIENDVKFDIPQSLVARRLEGLVQDATRTMMYQGVPQAEAEKRKEEYAVQFRPEAERQVKVAFILDAIGTVENIETNDDDVETRYEALAKQYQQPVETIKEHYAKNDMNDSLRAEIRNQKVVDFIKENADIK